MGLLPQCWSIPPYDEKDQTTSVPLAPALLTPNESVATASLGYSFSGFTGIGASGTGGSYDIRPTINPSVPGPPEGSAFSLAPEASDIRDL